MRAVTRHPDALDHVLMTLSAMLATYATGAGVNSPEIGITYSIMIAVAALVSFMVGRLARGKVWAKLDGGLYAAAVLATAIWFTSLNRFLPDGGYVREVQIAGLLSWMLVAGTLFCWRDSTLLFQFVPCIALFGLVGCWDYKFGPIFFFAFLVIGSTLFARSHRRSMLVVAEAEMGMEGADPASEERAVQRLRLGPWRWMAGPEWALASSAGVILFSVISAPIFQESVQGLAGIARVNAPPPPQPPPSTTTGPTASSLRIGQGPIRARSVELLEVKMDVARYLRSTTYLVYREGAWISSTPGREVPQAGPIEASARRPLPLAYDPEIYIPGGEVLPYSLRVLSGFHDKVPVPGDPTELPIDGQVYIEQVDGTVMPVHPLNRDREVKLAVLVPPTNRAPETARGDQLPVSQLTLATTTTGVTSRVFDMAQTAIKDAKSDFDKAIRIKGAIEQRVRYNLNAAAVPDGFDPVEYFLFESKEGYCDLFASSMALMARSVGLPARVVSGYFPNQPSAGDGMFVLREADRHLWCEIYFEDLGWVPFDPTEGAQAVAGGERGAFIDENASLMSRLPWGWIAGALLAVAVAGFVTSQWRRGGRAATKVARSSTRLAKLIRSFDREMDRRSPRARLLSQSLTDYALQIRDSLPGEGALASELAWKFSDALYSPREPQEDDLSAMVKLLKQIKAIKPSRA